MSLPEVRVLLAGGWRNAESVGSSDNAHRYFIWRAFDASGHAWAIKVPRRSQGSDSTPEPLEEYAARCWDESLRQARLFSAEGIHPRISQTVITIGNETSPGSILLRDALDLDAAMASVDNLDSVLTDPTLAQPYPLWATCHPWIEGQALVDRKGEFSVELTLGQVLEVGRKLAGAFCDLKKKGVYYLPLGHHVLVSKNGTPALTGTGHAIRGMELSRNPNAALRRFFSGLYKTQFSYAPEASWRQLIQFVEDRALRSFGYFLHDLAIHSQQTGKREDLELKEHLIRTATLAGHGLPGATVDDYSRISGARYDNWEEAREALDASPASQERTAIRIGIVFDYANVMTGLCGWDLNIAGLASSFNHYNQGRRVTYRYAAVVASPGKSKERIQNLLRHAGFEVGVIQSPTAEANQADDQELMRIMRLRAREIDEIVLLTADGHYAQTLRTLKEMGKTVRIVHFSPVSHKYGDWVDEVIPGLTEFRRFIRPGIPWGYRTGFEVTIDGLSE